MKVSVVIPAYNHADYLPECLESVLRQTRAPHEVIVIDDGATDNTPEVMHRYLNNPLLRYVRTENRGTAAARNVGIAMSSGDIIGLLDDDDVWYENKLELQIPLFSDPAVGIVYSGADYVCNGRIVKTHTAKRLTHNELLWAFMEDNCITNSTALIRRKCFDNVGTYRHGFASCDDFELWLRMAAKGVKFDCVEKSLISYRLGHSRHSCNERLRYESLAKVLDSILHGQETASAFRPGMIKRAWASYFARRAYWQYDCGNRYHAFLDSIHSLSESAGNCMAWRVLLKSILPRTIVQLLRHPDKDELGVFT